MQWQVTTDEIDDLLLPFLMSNDEAESDRLLEGLISGYVLPLVKQIINSKLRAYATHMSGGGEAQDLEDIIGEVVLHLLRRLRDLKSNPNSTAFRSFRSYIAVTSYNAFYTYLRKKNPQRWKLKNRLRYILTHQKSFALWECDDSEWLCGFAVWRNQNERACPSNRLRQLLMNSQDLERAGISYTDAQSENSAQLLASVFNWTGSPVVFDSLVGFISDLCSISDRLPQARDGFAAASEANASLLDLGAGTVVEVEQRLYLRRLWEEICELPLGQRRALLLNLRDANSLDMTTLLVHARIATIRGIAEALDIPAEEFAKMWNDLPMDDATIANRFGDTRQRIINLRQSARKRLSRRMSKLDQKKKE